MNGRTVKKIRKSLIGLRIPADEWGRCFRRAKKRYKKNPESPVIIEFGKRKKGEPLKKFRERRKICNHKKRLRLALRHIDMKCKKCNSEDLQVVQSGPQYKLFCNDCLEFQKVLNPSEAKKFLQLKAYEKNPNK